MNTFQIIYQGELATVRIDHEYNSITNDPVYFIDLPGKTLYIEMGDDGFWRECEGERTDEIQAIGELIEEHDY